MYGWQVSWNDIGLTVIADRWSMLVRGHVRLEAELERHRPRLCLWVDGRCRCAVYHPKRLPVDNGLMFGTCRAAARWLRHVHSRLNDGPRYR